MAGAQVIVTSFLFPDAKFSEARLDAVLGALGGDKEKLVIDLSCRAADGKWFVAMNRWQTITDMEVNQGQSKSASPSRWSRNPSRPGRVLRGITHMRAHNTHTRTHTYITHIQITRAHGTHAHAHSHYLRTYIHTYIHIHAHYMPSPPHEPLLKPREPAWARPLADTIRMLEPHCSEFLVHAADNEGLQRGIDEALVSRLAGWCGIPVTYAGGGRRLEDLDLVERLSHGKVDLTLGSALDCFGGSGVRLDECVQWNWTREV